MALINELKEMRDEAKDALEQEQVLVMAHQDTVDEWSERLNDLERAIAALEPASLTVEEIADVAEFVAELQAQPDFEELSELFENEKAEAREQLEADHALPVAPDDVVLTDIGRWKYRVCWDGYGDRFGDSHHETLDEAREELKKRDTDVLVIAAALYEAYSDGEGGVLWREIQRFDRPDNDVAAEGYAPVIEGDRPALDADMRDVREQPVEAIGYFIRDGQSLELRSDGSVLPLTPGDGAAPSAPWQADYWARKLSSPIAVAKRETEEVS